MKRIILLFFTILLFVYCKKNEKTTSIAEKKATNVFYDQAFEYLENNKIDSAFLYFNKAKDLFLLNKDSLGTGKCLVRMAIISADKGDHFGGQELALGALSYFNKNNKDHFVFLKANYNCLGITTSNLNNYKAAIKFYNSAIKFSDNRSNTFTYLNNIGIAYQELKNYKQALKTFESVLKLGSDNSIEYARALTNFAVTKWLQDPEYVATPELLKALNIRKQANDLRGQNSSYSHLSNYYTYKNLDSALYYANKMFQVSIDIKNPDAKVKALQKLIELSPFDPSKRYFKSYNDLNDSLEMARNTDKNQFALIRYETEKHKSDFLKAQAENLEKQKNILIKNIGIGILIVSLISGYFWYRRRQKILQQEKEIEVKNTALTYSKKVHDRVANKVYHVMTEVEYSPAINKESILQKLDVLYNISRDISHDTTDLEENKIFSRQLFELLISYRSENREINIRGNHDELWANITEEVSNEVFNILRELMTNMKKHSQSSEVTIQFQRLSQHINITYADNGIGIQKDAQYGNGLKNTETRIKNILGTITFETSEKKGLEILIYFPIN